MMHILYALQGDPHNEVIIGIREEAMSSDQNYGFEIRWGSHICRRHFYNTLWKSEHIGHNAGPFRADAVH